MSETAAAAVTAVALAGIAGLDAAFSGFRASCGRTGMVEHRHDDVVAGKRGLLVGATLLSPAVAITAVDLALRSGRLLLYEHAGVWMLTLYVPYGLVVLGALAAYVTLTWRLRFFASAVILGPLTLVRPVVAVAGAIAAVAAAPDPIIVAVVAWSVGAVLAVEPFVGRRWYRTIPVGVS